jgi:Outer membrane protein beta-barrel domain
MLAWCILLLQTSNAQNNRWKQALDSVNFYGFATLNFASLKGHLEDYQFGTSIGYTIGAYAEIIPYKRTGFVLGLQYSNRGASLKETGMSSSGSIDYKINYVDLLAGVSYHAFNRVKLIGYLSPGLRLSENLNYTYLGIDLAASETKNSKAFDFNVGAIVQFIPPINKRDKLKLLAGYALGLSDIGKKSSGFSGKNTNFTIGAAYMVN